MILAKIPTHSEGIFLSKHRIKILFSGGGLFMSFRLNPAKVPPDIGAQTPVNLSVTSQLAFDCNPEVSPEMKIRWDRTFASQAFRFVMEVEAIANGSQPSEWLVSQLTFLTADIDSVLDGEGIG